MKTLFQMYSDTHYGYNELFLIVQCSCWPDCTALTSRVCMQP